MTRVPEDASLDYKAEGETLAMTWAMHCGARSLGVDKVRELAIYIQQHMERAFREGYDRAHAMNVLAVDAAKDTSDSTRDRR